MGTFGEQEKLDRRVRKTRKALREAMQDLMSEKGYDQVTIEELTERADIGRTTFYLHYSAKQDLLLEQFDELLSQLLTELADIPLTSWTQQGQVLPTKDHPGLPVCMIFQHAADNEELYSLVLHGDGVDQASQRLQAMMTKAVSAFFDPKMDDSVGRLSLPVPVELFGNYFAGALLGMIKWWLDEGMPYTTEEMEAIFFQMFLPGASQVIGMGLAE